MEVYTAPMRGKGAFNCPHCGAFAKQDWGTLTAHMQAGAPTFLKSPSYSSDAWTAAQCSHCKEWSIWLSGVMIAPVGGAADRPNADLPDDIKADFEEARGIYSRSPRGAAALLRLCLQKICRHLGEPGKNIDTDIAALVRKGLPVGIQQAMDSVRVIGNEAVHPGTLDLRDDREIAGALFKVVNIVADKMLSEPKAIANLYGTLPVAKLKGIEQRDQPKLLPK